MDEQIEQFHLCLSPNCFSASLWFSFVRCSKYSAVILLLGSIPFDTTFIIY
jgi:hypothetical protein